ncbi:hypothetical protein BDQ17DRAFT_1246699, partial [Cyathus striatus]
KTLANLARTCLAFQEPALDALWSDLNSFSPLATCLPSDLWFFDPKKARRKVIVGDSSVFHIITFFKGTP